MKFSLFTLTAISLMSLNVMAKDTISATITILNNSKHAESQEGTSVHSYLAKSATSTIYKQMTGTGNFASLNQNTNETQLTTIGVDVQGYTQTILEDAGNGYININTDSNLTATQGDLSMNYTYQLQTQAMITKGSFQDYLEGKEIEYRLTEDSLEKEAKATGKKFSNSIEAALKSGLAAQGLNSITMDSNVSVQPKTEYAQACKATLKSLDCFTAKQEIMLDIRVRGL